MAGNVVERLIIEIGGDAKKFKDELKSLQKANKQGEKSFKELALVGKAGFLAVAAAAAALTVASTKAFIAFEKGAVNVAKTTNLAGKELEVFKKEIMDLSEEIPQTTDQLLEIATVSGQLGIKGTKNLVIFTETIAKLGATTDLEGGSAAIQIARILNLVDEGTETVDQFGSAIVDLGNNFETSESQILEIAGEVAKATINFKLSSSEVLGLSTAMSTLKIEAEAGSTVVGKAFMKIDEVIRKQAGPQFEKLIELTGMTGEQLTKTFQTDAASVFEAFIKGLGNAGKSGKRMADELKLLGLSGIRVNKILPTLAERSEKLTKVMKASSKAYKENTALNEEAAIAFEASAARLVVAQSKINNALIEIGAETAPAVVEAIESIAGAVRENSGAISSFGTAISFLIKSVLFLFGEGAKIFHSFVDKLKFVGDFLSAIVFFWIGAFLDFWKFSTKIFNFVSDVVSGFIDEVAKKFNLIKAHIQDKITKYLNILKDVATEVFDSISNKIGKWVDDFREKTKRVQQIASNIIGIFLAVGVATTKIFDAINNKISEFVDFFRKKITMVQGWVSSVTPDFLKFGDDATEGLKKAEGAAAESSKSIIESITELVKKYRAAGEEWVSSDEEVTGILEENKNKRVNSQEDETKKVKKETGNRIKAVESIIDKANKKRKRIEAKRLKNQAKLNEIELKLTEALAQNKNKLEIDALQNQFDKVKELNDINDQILKLQEKENKTALEQQQLEHLERLLALKKTAHEKEKESLHDLLMEVRKGEKTRTQITEEGIVEREKARIEEHNQRIKDEIKFGKTMAEIKAVQRSSEWQNTKTAASELSALTNSENKKMKDIGKAATIIQIGISTAESAMKAFNSLAWIPYVGTALGAIAAGAIVLYGAEQINNVRQMKDGGIVPGSGRGDKVPALLEPGELVVPRDIAIGITSEYKQRARGMKNGGVAEKQKTGQQDTFWGMFEVPEIFKAIMNGDDPKFEVSGIGAKDMREVPSKMEGAHNAAVDGMMRAASEEVPGGSFLYEVSKILNVPMDQTEGLLKDMKLYDTLEKFFGKDIAETMVGGGPAADYLDDLVSRANMETAKIFGFQNGGIVPGSGSGDIVPAMLEPGELVIPKGLTSSLLNISSGLGSIQIPTGNQAGGGGGEGGEVRHIVVLEMNDNAAEMFNAQLREGDNLGFLNRN